MNVQWCVFLITLPVLGGCVASGQHRSDGNAGVFYHYQCDDTQAFDVSYPSEQSAVLRLLDHNDSLIQVAAGSGAKYILDDDSTLSNPVTLYTKGDAARLDVHGVVYTNCSR